MSSGAPQVTVSDIELAHVQSWDRSNTASEVTPDEYARAIQNFANLSSGEGRAFQQLAEFLNLPARPAATEPADPFVTLYVLGENRGRPDQNSLGENTLPLTSTRSHQDIEPSFFHDPGAFRSHVVSDQASQIIFLSGFPSPKWLKSIGAKYRIDPEFFRRHLDILNLRPDETSFSEPSLPSSLWHLMHLPVYTLGVTSDSRQAETAAAIDARRAEARNALSAHHRQLRVPSVDDSRLGKSIVRNYHVLDDSHFVIEQRTSICLQQSGSCYILLIWLDSTLKWLNPAEEPWCPRRLSEGRGVVELLPIVRYKRDLGLKSHRIKTGAPTVAFGAPQTAALIHLDYARSPNHNALRQDATYALVELLRLTAASKCQLLNLLNTGLVQPQSDKASTSAVSSLIYKSQILTDLLQQTHEVRQSMMNTADGHWPKASGGAAQKVLTAWGALEADYQCLRERIQMTFQRYKETTMILMNTMAIIESREAILQAKKVSRLTFLAFIFIPLSFTTSFFGMNVKQLSQQSTSIWYWVATSVILSAIALFFLYVEKCVQFLAKMGIRFLHRIKSRDQQAGA